MSVYLHCQSHTPLVGLVDPEPAILDEVVTTISLARERIARFDPELVVLFGPDHYNGFFYDVMPSFCIGTAAETIGDFGTGRGVLPVPEDIAEACAEAVLDAGIDAAVSYRMQLDHAFAQPLEMLFGAIDVVPVLPVFINAVAPPLPSFQRARLLGAAVGGFLRDLNRRVLIIGSGGLSHQPPVPDLAHADAHMTDRLLGSGRCLPAVERAARENRVVEAARRFVEDPSSLFPLNPDWDRYFLDVLESGALQELDNTGNAELSQLAGKSTHEVKAWMAAFAALAAYGPYCCSHRYYRPIPEWIAGFGSISATLPES